MLRLIRRMFARRTVAIPGKYPWKGVPVDIAEERRAIQRSLNDLLAEIDVLAEKDAKLVARSKGTPYPRFRPF